MKYSIVWGRRAAADLDAIAEFIARDSKSSAQRVVRHIRKSALLLQNSPRLGKEIDQGGARELILSRYPYVVVYELVDPEVRIIAVFHQSQDRP